MFEVLNRIFRHNLVLLKTRFPWRRGNSRQHALLLERKFLRSKHATLKKTLKLQWHLNFSHEYYMNAVTCKDKINKISLCFLSVHLRGFICDGLGFRMYDGHFFCGYLSFLGCKRVWYSHHFCLYHRWLGREEREKWGGRKEGCYIKPETVRGNIESCCISALALNSHFQVN